MGLISNIFSPNPWARFGPDDLHHLINAHVKIILKHMASTQADLDAKLAELQTAIADVATRVGALTPSMPNFDSEVAGIQADLDALGGIAAAPAPAPTP